MIDKTFPRSKASAVLNDLGIIALENARTAVRQRQTFRATNKAENVAPLTFEFDPDGKYAVFAATLRNKRAPRKDPEKGSSGISAKIRRDPDKGDEEMPTLDIGMTPSRSRVTFRDDDDSTMPFTPLDKWEGDGEDHHAANLEHQLGILETMATEPDSGVNE